MHSYHLNGTEILWRRECLMILIDFWNLCISAAIPLVHLCQSCICVTSMRQIFSGDENVSWSSCFSILVTFTVTWTTGSPMAKKITFSTSSHKKSESQIKLDFPLNEVGLGVFILTWNSSSSLRRRSPTLTEAYTVHIAVSSSVNYQKSNLSETMQ